MKDLTLFSAIAIMTFFAACKKESTNGVITPLTGNWKLVSVYISDGSPGQWYDQTGQSPKYVNFSNNGTVTGNEYPGFVNYSVTDSIKLNLYKANHTDTLTFRFQIRKDTLEMSPAGKNMCIEGCAVRFIKQK